MAITVANVELTHTYDYWRIQTNLMAAAFGKTLVADSNTTVGNVALNGTFRANTVDVDTIVAADGEIVVQSHTTFDDTVTVTDRFTVGNSTVNTSISPLSVVTSNLVIGQVSANSTHLWIGSATKLDEDEIVTLAFKTTDANGFIANTTVVKVNKTTLSNSGISIGDTAASNTVLGHGTLDLTTSVSVGNSTINTTANSTNITATTLTIRANTTLGNTKLSNTTIETSGSLTVGNSTVNTEITPTTITTANASFANVVMSTAPSLVNHLTRKDYVDARSTNEAIVYAIALG